MIQEKDSLTGELNTSIVHIYPELESLEVTPSLKEQTFKPKKYGYETVKVKGIPAEDLNIKPLKTEQTKEGLYKKVTVEGIKGDNLNITPTETLQNFDGIYENVNVEAIQTEEITPNIDYSNTDKVEFTPTAGKYIKKATINKDVNLVAENIKNGVNIFGINGTLDVSTPSGGNNNDIVVSLTEPTGENRKAIWYQKGENLFDKDNPCKLSAYVDTGSNTLKHDNKTRGIYVKIKPNTTYKVSKTAAQTFRIATLKNEPQLNASIINTVADHTGSSLTITANSNANYLFVYYFNTDTGGDEQAIMNTIRIEEYIEPKLYMLNENNEYVEVE